MLRSTTNLKNPLAKKKMAAPTLRASSVHVGLTLMPRQQVSAQSEIGMSVKEADVAYNIHPAKKTPSAAVRLDQFRHVVADAGLEQKVAIERDGVPQKLVGHLLDETGISPIQFQQLIGIPKATFVKKKANNEPIAGASGHSIVGLVELINKADEIVAAQNISAAKQFDAAKWVGEWIYRKQPALGGLRPADFMDTPSGRESVKRLLGSLQSGAYQ
jgi:uncharacterized protein (DUF2384 family)